MRRLFVMGATKPGYFKRHLRAINVLAGLFDEVYYQYADYDDDVPFDLPINVIPLPLKIDREEFKSAKRIAFEKEIINMVREYGRDYLYAFNFLRFFPFKPFTMPNRVIFETAEYYPAGVLYPIESYVVGKLKEWTLLPIHMRMLELVDGIVATVPRDVFPWNKIVPNFYQRFNVFYIPNFSALRIKPIREREKVICFGATRKIDIKKMESVFLPFVREGYRVKLIGHDCGMYDKLPSYISCVGYIPYSDYVKILSRCAFSVMEQNYPGYSPNLNMIWTIPHKFFDSLGAGTPVIVSEKYVPMSTLVKKYDVGVVLPRSGEITEEQIEDSLSKYDIYLRNIERNQGKFVWNKEKGKRYKDFLIRVYNL